MKYEFNDKEHIHTLDGKPLSGTSSVVGVLAKPALIQWAANMACDYISHNSDNVLSGDLSHIGFQVKNETLAEARYAHRNIKQNAAKTGTDLHAELERYVKHVMASNDFTGPLDMDKKIIPFVEWAQANVKKFIWSEAHCYSERLWVGGISDAGAELKDGRLAVIDFKSSKEAYPGQFLQDAGYAIQIEENGLFSQDGNHSKVLDKKIDALIVVPFGAKIVEPVIKNNVEDFKKGFEAAVVLYRLLGLDK